MAAMTTASGIYGVVTKVESWKVGSVPTKNCAGKDTHLLLKSRKENQGEKISLYAQKSESQEQEPLTLFS